MAGRTRWLAIAILAGAVGLASCDILDVEDPQSIELDELDTELGARALLNGAELTASIAAGRVAAIQGIIADEMTYVGSRQEWGRLDQGFVSEPGNQFIDAAFQALAAARWSAEQALLANPGKPAAVLYLASTLLLIVETFDDFVVPPGFDPVPSVGEGNMDALLQRAESILSESLARSPASEDRIPLTALRARVRHARGVWASLNPSGATPSEPLVASEGIREDAETVLAAVQHGWRWGFSYSDVTATPEYAFQLFTGSAVIGAGYLSEGGAIALVDPETGLADATLARRVDEVSGDGHAFLPMVSATEMHLLLAEDALATADTAGFVREIDAVRGWHGRAPSAGISTPVQLLEHERRVHLFLQGRRLLDQYRFGRGADRWDAQSPASTSPGTLLPIPESERVANPFVG